MDACGYCSSNSRQLDVCKKAREVGGKNGESDERNPLFHLPVAEMDRFGRKEKMVAAAPLLHGRQCPVRGNDVV